MARTISMAQSPRPGAAKPAPSRQILTKPVVGKPSAPHKKHPARRGGLGGWVTLVVVGLATAGAVAWYGLSPPPPADTSAQLLAQMEAATQGEVAPTHVFGGALTVSRAQGRVNVVAEGVPSRACVQVGWRLAREGTIIVNGTLSPRLSAARLSELCSGDAATLMWVPEE